MKIILSIPLFKILGNVSFSSETDRSTDERAGWSSVCLVLVRGKVPLQACVSWIDVLLTRSYEYGVRMACDTLQLVLCGQAIPHCCDHV